MSRFVRSAILALVAALCLGAVPAQADDWVAGKLRGVVLRLVDGDWVRLQRGDVVPDDDVIRTLESGQVQFVRDAERIDLGPNTQIQIFDKIGKRFTTVKQYFGTVSIEANVENVQHFAVETPFLAAVVKGTKFTVMSGETGAIVKVTRGHVAVEDMAEHHSTLLGVGQQAAAAVEGDLSVSGNGDLPGITDANGLAVPNGDLDVSMAHGLPILKSLNLGKDTNPGNSSNGNSGNGNSGNSSNGNSGNGNDQGDDGNESGNGYSGNGNSNNGNGNGNSGNSGHGGGLLGGLIGGLGGLLGH